jgi:hypothetical protein
LGHVVGHGVDYGRGTGRVNPQKWET